MITETKMKQNLCNSRHIWYQDSANDIFAAAISLNRFTFINRLIEFDDKHSRKEHMRKYFENPIKTILDVGALVPRVLQMRYYMHTVDILRLQTVQPLKVS